jgi:hypothetical protein
MFRNVNESVSGYTLILDILLDIFLGIVPVTKGV